MRSLNHDVSHLCIFAVYFGLLHTSHSAHQPARGTTSAEFDEPGCLDSGGGLRSRTHRKPSSCLFSSRSYTLALHTFLLPLPSAWERRRGRGECMQNEVPHETRRECAPDWRPIYLLQRYNKAHSSSERGTMRRSGDNSTRTHRDRDRANALDASSICTSLPQTACANLDALAAPQASEIGI